MSDEFDDLDDLYDDSFLRQVDALEAVAIRPSNAPKLNGNGTARPAARPQTSAARSVTGPSNAGRPFQAPSENRPTNARQLERQPQPRASTSAPSRPSTGANPNPNPNPDQKRKIPSSDPYDMSLDLSPNALETMTRIEQDFRHRGAGAGSGGGGGGMRQTTLYGTTAVVSPPARTQQQRSAAGGTGAGPGAGNAFGPSRAPFGRPSARTKQWDRTAFAATGTRNKGKGKVAGKGKGKAHGRRGRGEEDSEDEDGEEEEEDVEFEQFPEVEVPCNPPPPMKLVPDPETIREWFYPINKPLRDYQYNIVQSALFKNTLVALPTGLGKTFIAGVLMLNYYRWFPEGKVVFVAPTKPLVSQQIKACHETCGIPREDAVEMTGETPQAQRQRYWQSKRVVYMTPQTLQNDLLREVVDARDIILLVVDEAHKATGQYAYATVVRFLMARNPHFRVLALTATPGAKPEAVQEVVDSLHIGNIEIRDEKSLDLREYIHEKSMEKCVVPLDVGIACIREKLIALMESTVKPLRGKDIIPDYLKLADVHPYRCKMWIDDLRRKPQGKQFPWAASLLMRLHKLTFAMAYLCEESVEMAYQTLLDAAGKKTTHKEGNNKLGNDVKYRELIAEIEDYRNERVTGGGPVGHPKMDKLVAVALEHFAAPDDGAEHTRVMVFCQYRDCVDEIVKSLNLQQPLIRAARFIGQGHDKRGDKGMAQKAQIGMIKRFKDGEFNVLVATSIGEEGLDIGEVDLIICYDVQKSSIKMLQRIGRTGRKRDGKIVVLMAEGREEPNWDQANENYSSVQQSIIRGDQLELFDDDERLIPDNVKPVVRKQHMEIQEFVREDDKAPKKRKARGDGDKPVKRRKRNADPNRNIPEGAISGFISAAKLVVKGKKGKGKQITVEDLERELEDDSDDLEIESGRLSGTPVTPPREKRKAALSKIARAKRAKAPDRRISSGSTIEDLARALQDDSDDMELEQGVDDLLNDISPSPRRRAANEEAIILLSSDEERGEPDESPSKLSPIPGRPTNHRIPSGEPPVASWLLDSDSENEHLAEDGNPADDPPLPSTSPWRVLKTSFSNSPVADMQLSPIKLSPIQRLGRPDSSPVVTRAQHSAGARLQLENSMGPPPIPSRRVPSSSDDSPLIVRKSARLKNKDNVQPHDSGPNSHPPPAMSSSPVIPKPKARRAKLRIHAKPNPFFDVEAALSGSDQADDASQNSEWSESDRRFIKDSPATQAVSGRDQHALYLQGLMTQAPGRGPFKDGPIRKGAFWGGKGIRRRVVSSSSEGHPSSEPNEYEFGSFVVADDDSFEVDEVEEEVSMH